MKWYIVKLVFNIHISNDRNSSQFDEQLRLVEASDPTSAFAKARLIGNKEEHSFTNDKGENVSWKFIDVAELNFMNELKHGAEIYSHTHEDNQPEDYINFIRLKSLMIQSGDLIYA